MWINKNPQLKYWKEWYRDDLQYMKTNCQDTEIKAKWYCWEKKDKRDRIEVSQINPCGNLMYDKINSKNHQGEDK